MIRFICFSNFQRDQCGSRSNGQVEGNGRAAGESNSPERFGTPLVDAYSPMTVGSSKQSGVHHALAFGRFLVNGKILNAAIDRAMTDWGRWLIGN
jgi:hypothetical protein